MIMAIMAMAMKRRDGRQILDRGDAERGPGTGRGRYPFSFSFSILLWYSAWKDAWYDGGAAGTEVVAAVNCAGRPKGQMYMVNGAGR